VGAIATIGPYLWPYLLRPLRKRFQSLRLLLKEGFTHTLLAELKNGYLDDVIASETFE